MLKGRRSEFIQLLCNLLGNAADALEEAKADRISLRMFRQGDKIHILVEDGGKGIPAHLTEKIFEPFFTTKRSGQGTGLGLAVVRTLTKKWQAELQVGRSQTLGGASFDISLPVAS
jgi:two-component system C4-dicarboxylate transport sensor histidine kinase DctB